MSDDTTKKDKPDWFDELQDSIDQAWKSVTEPDDKKKPDSGDPKKKPEGGDL